MVRILTLRRDDGRDPPRDAQMAFALHGDDRLRDHLLAALDAAIAAYTSQYGERIVHWRQFPDRDAGRPGRPGRGQVQDAPDGPTTDPGQD